MNNYLDAMERILREGTFKGDRTDVGSSKFVSSMEMSWHLYNGFPAQTLRPVSARISFEETMLFLRGDTDTGLLEKKNINIWKGNTSREFLDKQGLHDFPVGSMGKGYGFQWRNFGGNLGVANGVDQIKDLLANLSGDPSSRRHVVTAWNPSQEKEMALPPCHLMHMYTINPEKNELNSCFIMRSLDLLFGGPYDIMNYAFLNIFFAKLLGLKPGQLSCYAWDAHIYSNQIEMAEQVVLRRDAPALPSLEIHKEIKTFDDILSLEWSDIELVDYNPLPDFKNKPKMAV